jgi:4-alpha-glucanotransferase
LHRCIPVGTNVSDADLAALADAAGIAPSWRDVQGQIHQVAPATLRAVLRAIGLEANTDAAVRDTIAELRQHSQDLPPLLTATVDQPVRVHGPLQVTLEGGGTLDGVDEVRVPAPGYHTLECSGHRSTLAVAPPQCYALPPGRPWGLSAQLYSLRRPGDAGIGDFAALRALVRAAAARGADAMAISPVHAQFSADPDRFSPYAPSSRVMLNVLHADAETGDDALEQTDLIDWPRAARLRLVQFRRLFEVGAHQEGFAAFRAALGAPLEAHARFEALHAYLYGNDPLLWHWRSWPEKFRDPSNPAVQEFARDHAREVTFHAYLQFLADRGLGAAQQEARDAGMRIGLVSDLAVGADGGGSQAWSRQHETLIGLNVGAPPDLLGPEGQDWGLAAFSPRGLQLNGFAAFIEMLRAALRHAGGVRIDHVMGLQRLWVLPEGASATEGAYLRFPVDDLLRLVALESFRHQAIVLGEDLGTVPDGFRERLIDAGVLGMRVLWFERDGDRFTPPGSWSRKAVAMTSTHDLPTVAGWWRGRDLEWRGQLKLLCDENAVWFAHENRARDRTALWDAFRDSGAAGGDAPPPQDGARVADVACKHVAGAACELALLPLEDALGLEEQPNLPGTLHEHPNWRRRLPCQAANLLDAPEVAARIDALSTGRKST